MSAGLSKPPHPMRVCMLVEHLPPTYSGAGRQALQLAGALAALEIQTTFLCTTPFPELPNIPRVQAETLARQHFPIHAALWLLRHRRTYDIIHIHGFSRAMWPAILLGKLLRKKVLFKYTLPADEAPEYMRATRFGKWKWRLFSSMDAYIALSSALQDTLFHKKRLQHKVHPIPNGVDTTMYCPYTGPKIDARASDNKTWDWPPNAAWVIYLGALEPRKGLDALLSAWQHVLATLPHARLLLLGDAPRAGGETYREKLVSYVQKNKLESSIHFYGNTDAPQDLLPLADVFVLPTQAEGLPNALIEAQACGVPAVASHLEGVTTDIVDHGETGLLTPVGDAPALAEAIIRILTEPEWRSPEKQAFIRQRCVERFSIENVVAQYAELYRKLLEQ